MTQDEAADALGVDVRTWRRYELGEVNDPTRGFEVRNASRRRLLDRIAKEFGLSEREILVEGAGAPEGHVLQPARHFVGRDAELATLRAWRDDDRVRVLTVVAPGGTGKTALVRELVRGGSARVWSFYESPDADAFIAAVRGYDGLVVLDGVETLQSEGRTGRARGEVDAPALRRWLRRVADRQEPARAVVTSRLPLVDLDAWTGDAVRVLELGPLDASASRELLRRHGLRAHDAALDDAVAHAGGHALTLDVLGSYTERFLGGDLAQATGLDVDAAATEDPQARRLARLLRRYAERLDPVDRDLLARLAAFSRGASVDALDRVARAHPPLAGSLAGVTRATLTHRMARLAELGLVFAQRDNDRYAAHPFVRDVFRALGPERALHDTMRAELLASLSSRPGAAFGDATSLEPFAELLEHTLGAGLPEDAAAIYLRALGGFSHVGMTLGAFAFLLRAVSAFSPERHPSSLDASLSPSARLALSYDWGLCASALGELGLADAAFRVHGEVAAAMGARGRQMVLHRAQAFTARLAGRFDDALGHARSSIAQARRLDSLADVSRGHCLEGMVQHAMGDLDAADAAFARATDAGDVPGARRGLWRAALLAERGARDAARSMARAVLDDMRARRWLVHAAEAEMLLGRFDLADGDLAAAHARLASSRAVAEVTGEVELGIRAHALAHQIARAEGDTVIAARQHAAGRERVAAHRANGLAGLFDP